MKTISIGMMALWAAGLGAGSTVLGCQKEASSGTHVAAADKSAEQKAASDKMAADKSAADKAIADKAAKAAADKATAEKAAADKTASLAKADASALPPDLMAMKAEITRMTAQMDLTMAKLDTLSTATGDLDKPSEDAHTAMETLETEMQVLKKRAEGMRDRGAAYFEAWEKELASMTTSDVSAIAAKRKEELAAKYADVLTAMQETRAALDAYSGDMKKIREVIEEDVTPETQKGLAEQVKAAKEKAATLKSRVDATFAKLGQVGLIYGKH